MKQNKTTIWIRALAPGIITAALVFGPSKITIASKLGAEYGFDLLWTVVIAIFFMKVFTSMAARIGMARPESLLDTIKRKWGKGAGVAMGLGVFLVTVSFQAGNSIGIGMALAELTHTDRVPWIIFFNLVGIGLLFFRSFYVVLEKVMLLLIGFMLLAFVTTFFLVQPPLSQLVSGLRPTIPTGSIGVLTAFVASCFSVVAAVYQTYLIQEKKRLLVGAEPIRDRSFTGIFILGLLTAVVLICSAVVLHPEGVKVVNATSMALALEPLFGRYASVLFLGGLFGASFSALIGNSTLGGTILGDALGYGSQLKSRPVKGIIALIMTIGAAVAIAFGRLPIELIVFAQSITILVTPFIGLALYLIAGDKVLMGEQVNSVWVRIVGGIGLGVIVVLAVQSVWALFS